MSEHVWFSDARQQTSLIMRVDTDISVNDEDKAIEGQKLNQKGKPVPAELCPTMIWGDDTAPHFGRMPDLFYAMSQWIVSSRAADVLRQYDLGGGALYPVSGGVFEKDRSTRVPGDYFCWTFGNSKNAFLPEQSENVSPPQVPGLWWDMAWKPKDNEVAVSRAALEGPDIWLDAMLFKSIFMSGALGDALEQAGLTKAFHLHRCRVI
jgi:hypothetical protein